MVISTISLNPFATANLKDAYRLGTLNPYDNPLTLSKSQAQALENIFKSLQNDNLTDAQKALLQRARDEYEKAKKSGVCKIQ
jgi:hypothetical protein